MYNIFHPSPAELTNTQHFKPILVADGRFFKEKKENSPETYLYARGLICLPKTNLTLKIKLILTYLRSSFYL